MSDNIKNSLIALGAFLGIFTIIAGALLIDTYLDNKILMAAAKNKCDVSVSTTKTIIDCGVKNDIIAK